jgi:hypothetical protein
VYKRGRLWLAAVGGAVALVAALTTVPAGAAPAKTLATVPRTAASPWKWTKLVAIPGKGVSLGGVSCPSVHLCVADGNRGKTEGIYYTTKPGGGGATWKFVPWTEAYSGGGSGEDLSCDQAGVHYDCAIAGFQPLPGHPNESFGGSLFQTGNPMGRNWGMALLDTSTNGDFGAISCWSGPSCAELDDAGNVYTTAGATATSATALFPQDDGFSGIWSIGCAPYVKGQPNFFCAAVDQNAGHSIGWSTDPTDGKWTTGAIPVGGDDLDHIACGGPGLCVVTINSDAGTGSARIAVSHGNTASVSWDRSFVKFDLLAHSQADISAVGCSSKTLCAAAGIDAIFNKHPYYLVSVSTNPGGGTKAWHTTTIPFKATLNIPPYPLAINCPSTHLCVMVTSSGKVTVGT